MFALTTTALPTPIRREAGIDVRSESEPANGVIVRSFGPMVTHMEHGLLYPRGGHGGKPSTKKSSPPRIPTASGADTQGTVKNDLKQEGKNEAGKVAEKVATKLVVKAATEVIGLAVPVVGELITAAETLATAIEDIVKAVKEGVKKAHDVRFLLWLSTLVKPKTSPVTERIKVHARRRPDGLWKKLCVVSCHNSWTLTDAENFRRVAKFCYLSTSSRVFPMSTSKLTGDFSDSSYKQRVRRDGNDGGKGGDALACYVSISP